MARTLNYNKDGETLCMVASKTKAASMPTKSERFCGTAKPAVSLVLRATQVIRYV